MFRLHIHVYTIQYIAPCRSFGPYLFHLLIILTGTQFQFTFIYYFVRVVQKDFHELFCCHWIVNIICIQCWKYDHNVLLKSRGNVHTALAKNTLCR